MNFQLCEMDMIKIRAVYEMCMAYIPYENHTQSVNMQNCNTKGKVRL